MATGKRKVSIPGHFKAEHPGLTTPGVKERIEKLLKCLENLTVNKERREVYKECINIIDYLNFEVRLINELYIETSHYSKKSTLVRRGSPRTF